MSGPPSHVTDLLARWRAGDRDALDALVPLVYDELRRLARHYLRQERPGHTLQSTALVHEAFVRLVGHKPPQWKDRAHFFAVAAQLMRRILVDHARRRGAAKRGSNGQSESLSEDLAISNARPIDLLALDEALNALAALDARQSRIVELRFFGGLSLENTSEVLGISPATVKREWATAGAWLYQEMARATS